jgi:hypothetical protein
MADEKNLTLYRSPQWALVLEIYLAGHAVIIGWIGSLQVGPLSQTLHYIDEYLLWTVLFCGLGAGLFVTALLEFRCRATGSNCACIRRFAVARELFNVGLLPCWGFAVLTIVLSEGRLVLVPAIAAQAIVALVVLQVENVRAQRLKAKERRSDSALVPGDHGFSG